MEKINLKLKYLKGWFLFCPIFWCAETRELGPRFMLWPLFTFAIGIWHIFLFFTINILMIDIEPGYPIKITDTRWR